MTRRILINGRFLEDEKTAVNAVAHALSHSLIQNSRDWDVEVLVPKATPNEDIPAHWPVRRHGLRTGPLWDQLDLPTASGRGVVTGFFNTVPLRGRGYVTLLHDAHVFDVPGSFPPMTRHWRQLLSRRAGQPGNHVLTVSEQSKQALLNHRIGTSDRIGVAPNGPGPVATAKSDPSVLESLRLTPSRPFCLAQASLAGHKNLDLLLRTFARPDMADMTLVCFGATDKTAVEAAGHAISDNIVFAGKLSDGELAALYQASLAVCVPSRAEGFGLPALEAMVFDRPVIVAPCGALPEVVGHAGLTVPPDAPELWAQTILKLASDPALVQRLGKDGQARAQEFTWANSAAAVLENLDRWYPP